MKKEVTCAILGYGGRGRLFSETLKCIELFGKVVAVAEPDPKRRERAARENNLPADMVFAGADELLARPKLADAILNGTMDRMHVRTAVPAMEKGYAMLLEKPMASTYEDCLAIEQAQRRTGAVLAVCHSLRYLGIYGEVRRMVKEGIIGEVVSFDAIDGLRPIHQAHSFVRGNWANEARSTFMLLAKCCHDIDAVQYVLDRKCEKVSSFGKLTYFVGKNKPEGAPPRCTDGCPVEDTCEYSAVKVYLQMEEWRLWLSDGDDETIMDLLRNGPHGRCVYQLDNDAVDHQVVAFEYEGGMTGTFTMTAFHPGGRFMRVHGTKGYLDVTVDDRTIKHTDFVSRKVNTIKMPVVKGGHGGGDYMVIGGFLDAVRKNDPSTVLTTAQESLDSHRIVFAAEKSRREKRTVSVDEFE